MGCFAKEVEFSLAHNMALVKHSGAAVANVDDVNSNLSAGDEFPMLCETCLGPNPYIRMVKLAPGAKLCKINGKPFQSFRWKPAGGRQKETIISYSVAKDRNICQVCLNDMKYGVPAGVRDKLEAAESAGLIIQTSDGLILTEDGRKSDSAIAMTLESLKRGQERQQREGNVAYRNLAKLCSFWVLGTCSRVVNGSCPFRPCCGSFAFPEIQGKAKDLSDALIKKLKEQGPLEVMKTLDIETRNALKNARKGVNQEAEIQARVDGSDSLSKKYLHKANRKKLDSSVGAPPDDNVATLWIGGVEEIISEEELSSVLLRLAGEIKSLRVLRAAKCAFVSYASQADAVAAANALWGKLEINGNSLSVKWAKPKAKAPGAPGDAPATKKRRA